jgi:hypothetical protein
MSCPVLGGDCPLCHFGPSRPNGEFEFCERRPWGDTQERFGHWPAFVWPDRSPGRFILYGRVLPWISEPFCPVMASPAPGLSHASLTDRAAASPHGCVIRRCASLPDCAVRAARVKPRLAKAPGKIDFFIFCQKW